MTPGRELDALVSEKVMGIPVTKEGDRYWPPARPGANFSTHEIPEYSTNLAAAWLVVEHMHSLPKPVLQLAAPQQDYSNEKWRAEFSRKWWNEGVSPYQFACEAETVPHVICLAALKWFES